jgi:peptide/nickel transport system permease protein
MVVAIFVVVNLLVDLSYAWLDPRVRDSLGKARTAV